MYTLFIILIITIILFVWGKWRYDIVALMALMASVLTGVVPFHLAFTGFANPAVVTVACVMVLTYAISESGILDYLIHQLTPITKSETVHITVLTVLTAVLSAFMNNVGALALMMPVAIQTSFKAKRSPSMVLMPLAFGSVLGGLVTAIGTPPNLLISAYRGQVLHQSFSMFAFTPVGIVVASVGVLFIVTVGWRLLPVRKTPKNNDDLFQIQDYITEVKVTESSKVIGQTLKEFEKIIDAGFSVIGMIRKKRKRLVIPDTEILEEGDILIIEASHDNLEKIIAKGKLQLVTGETISSELLGSDKISVVEAVIPQGSRAEGRSSYSMRLRSRYKLNLIALARQGNPFKDRLNKVNLRAGDVVLLQGETESIQESALSLGFLPLVERDIKIGFTRKLFLPTFIFLLAIIAAAFQVVPIEISFATAVGSLVLLNIVPARKLYDCIDWSIVFLLGALIPVGQALKTTGATLLITHFVQSIHQDVSPIVVLAVLFFITMTLSDLMNNAATAVIMAPIAVTLAKAMHVNIDPFLMTVAVSASCSFLTPISHQNNTLVMGPGGYKFYDYLRLGIPLEIIIMIIAVPMIIWIWPL